MVKGLATFPSSQRRGGPKGRGGRFGKNIAGLTTPSARTRVASRYFLDRAATPPLRGGE